MNEIIETDEKMNDNNEGDKRLLWASSHVTVRLPSLPTVGPSGEYLEQAVTSDRHSTEEHQTVRAVLLKL